MVRIAALRSGDDGLRVLMVVAWQDFLPGGFAAGVELGQKWGTPSRLLGYVYFDHGGTMPFTRA